MPLAPSTAAQDAATPLRPRIDDTGAGTGERRA